MAEKKKRLKKRLDYPTVVFLQLNRINKLLSSMERVSWPYINSVKRAVDALESNLKPFCPGENVTKEDMADIENKNKEINDMKDNTDKMDRLLELLQEKYAELNILAQKAKLYTEYPEETPEYGE